MNQCKQEIISSKEAAAILGIHQASIRNWIRHGYLHPLNENSSFFNRDDVELLKEKIVSGDIQRLNKRANKSNAAKTFVPEEYSSRPDITSRVFKVSDFIVNNKLDVNTSLFYLTINLLQNQKLLKLSERDLLKFHSDNPYLQMELTKWMQELPQLSEPDLYRELLLQFIPNEEDILGFIYQSVLAEGCKVRQGSYYTPGGVVLSILNDYIKPELKILDPCCGTGKFLLAAASVSEPENIYGIDTDELAVKIARINLMLKFQQKHFNPNVFCYNALLNTQSESQQNFDLIISNPPWGMHWVNGEAENLKKIYPEIISGESFSYFIRRSTDLLKEGGCLSFILPEAILYVKAHKDIRNYILKNYRVISIISYGQIFKNVFTKVIRLDLKKTSDKNMDSHIRVSDGRKSFYITQNSFSANPDCRFSFYKDDDSRTILEKIYAIPHTTLKRQAEWALGIVTGDNKKYISPVRLDNYVEIYTGREVSAYNLELPKSFIKFQPEQFQQVAPLTKYRAPEKLIYRFISSRLVFAYDNQQKLTLNSANILTPTIPDYPIKTILALFNSSVYQFIFQQKFNSIKVLRSHLEALPLPLWTNEVHLDLINYVDEILNGKDLRQELDQYILEKFKLTGSEMEYIRKSI